MSLPSITFVNDTREFSCNQRIEFAGLSFEYTNYQRTINGRKYNLVAVQCTPSLYLANLISLILQHLSIEFDAIQIERTIYQYKKLNNKEVLYKWCNNQVRMIKPTIFNYSSKSIDERYYTDQLSALSTNCVGLIIDQHRRRPRGVRLFTRDINKVSDRVLLLLKIDHSKDFDNHLKSTGKLPSAIEIYDKSILTEQLLTNLIYYRVAVFLNDSN